MRSRRTSVGLALLIACAACREGEHTGMIVEVAATADVIDQIDEVRIQVWNTDVASPVVEESFPVRDGPLVKMPARLGLRPADPARSSMVRIEAAGLRGPAREKRAGAETTVTFMPSDVKRVLLILGASCPGGCGPDQTCGITGACVSVGRDPGSAPGSGPTTGPGLDASPARDGSGGPILADGGSRTPPDTTQPPRDGGSQDRIAPPPPRDGPSQDGAAPAPPAPSPPAPSPPAPSPPAPAPPPDSGAPSIPRLGLGQPCQGNGMCDSRFCVDGVCCDTDCAGTCRSCLSTFTSGANGTCALVAATRDPDSECGPQPAATCGNIGGCDGAGACRKHPAGTSCRGATCQNNLFSSAASCTGQGACVGPAPVSCERFRCSEQGCPQACSGHEQCLDSAYCNAGECVDRKSSGACSSDRECLLGLVCLLGICL